MSQSDPPSNHPILRPKQLESIRESLDDALRSVDPTNTPEYQARWEKLMAGITPLPELLRKRKPGRRKQAVSAGGESEPLRRQFIHKPWPGSNSWHNWGIGRDKKGVWHLFHFQRASDARASYRWIRHRYARVAIPQGAVDRLAQKLLSDGFVMGHKKYRYLVTRLRNAIRDSLAGEGHSPQGDPIPWDREKAEYRPAIKFGIVQIRGSGRRTREYTFLPRD